MKKLYIFIIILISFFFIDNVNALTLRGNEIIPQEKIDLLLKYANQQYLKPISTDAKYYFIFANKNTSTQQVNTYICLTNEQPTSKTYGSTGWLLASILSCYTIEEKLTNNILTVSSYYQSHAYTSSIEYDGVPAIHNFPNLVSSFQPTNNTNSSGSTGETIVTSNDDLIPYFLLNTFAICLVFIAIIFHRL